MRPRRTLAEKEAEALKKAIRIAFEQEELKRDEVHEEQVSRLLKSLDEFEGGQSAGSSQ